MSEEGKLQNYSVDQVAGAVVLVLGAVASLLLVIWQSKCHCKMNLCYIFQCERRPPNEDEMKKLQDEYKGRKDKKDNEKNNDKEKDNEKNNDKEKDNEKNNDKEKNNEKKKEENDIENDLELLPNHNQ